jgi:hypothetical protein
VSLDKAALAVVDTRPGPKCGVHTLQKALSPKDLELFCSWLPIDSGKKSSWISEVLKADGYSTSEMTIARHRRGKCSCGTV